MNLHAIASPYIGTVNPSIPALWKQSNGYTTSEGGKRTPQYVDTPNTLIQMQALSGKELAHLNNLDIQGVLRGLYVKGEVQGVSRVRDQGGDLFVVNETGETWLVVQVLETWINDGKWSKVGVCLQQ